MNILCRAHDAREGVNAKTGASARLGKGKGIRKEY
jgi:hypothetical protein